jgi:hypothetical protein
MTCVLLGPATWSASRSEIGHRTYKLHQKVQCSTRDGPANVMQTPGLPIPGNFWFYFDDIDIYAFCKYDMEVTPSVEGEANTQFDVVNTFTTQPWWKFCPEQEITDPLLTPQRVSGGSVRYQEEVVYDKDGNPVTNSAFELFHGAKAEFDRNRGQIKISQNVAFLDLATCEGLRDTVNAYPLWGLDARCIKLSDFTWERKFYGTCYVYYERNFTFDLKADGFDRELLDEGTKVLRGEWVTDPLDPDFGRYDADGDADDQNPADFIRFVDFNGNPANVVLNGFGQPADLSTPVGTAPPTGGGPAKIPVRYYQDGDLLQLGIPVSF